MMKTRTVIQLIITLILILLLWFFANKWVVWTFGNSIKSEQFNNVFNSLTSLFTALAFGGVIITLLLQRQDINIQNEINNLQNFENNFFRFLEQHHRVIDSFVIEVKPNKKDDTIEEMPETRKKISQLDAFDFLAKDFKFRFDKIKEIRFHADTSYDTIFTYAFLHHTYGKYGYMLSHYYRNLYHIIKFIDESKALKNISEKRKYVNILRAQLSAPEINLIAWDGMTKHGAAFKPLIQKYKLLKNMNFTYEMVDIEWLAEIYPHIKKEIRKENPIFSFKTDIGLNSVCIN
jgi:Putative phage abortive infection protein